MTKKKLLLVVGAGASIEFGLPSVGDVRKIINDEAQKWYPLADRLTTNLYEYIEQPNKQRSEHKPTFERILYRIFELSAAKSAQESDFFQAAFLNLQEFPDVLLGQDRKKVDSHTLRQLSCSLEDALLSKFRELCRASEQEKKGEFARLKSFLTALQAEFDIAVVTLNYDNIMHRALPDIETGFDQDSGVFRQERIFDRTRWPCLLHLHGSVHFDMRMRGIELHEIHWQQDINAKFENSFGRAPRQSTEGLNFPTSVIVAGYGKPFQLLRRPFRTYYSELDRLVNRCDAVVFAGYGFGDVHLNMAFEGYRNSRRRPVVIIKRAKTYPTSPINEMTVSGAGMDNDQSVRAILDTFSTHYSSMRWLGNEYPGSAVALVEAKEFETCCNSATPLSFWYDGMLSACDHVDKVLAQLR